MPIPCLKPGVLPLSAIGEWGWAISWRSLDFAAAASGIRFAFAQPDRAAFAGVANKCKSTRATVEARRTTVKCGRFCRQVFAWKVGGVPDSKDGDTCSSNNSRSCCSRQEGSKVGTNCFKIVTQARFMRDGWSVGKILSGVARFAPGTTVTRSIHGTAAACRVESLRVGDVVLTMSQNLEAVWTDVLAVVVHRCTGKQPLVGCTIAGKESISELSATSNHKVWYSVVASW